MKDRTAIVTGGSRGIGRAICVEFAKRGANLLINYAGNSSAAEETAEICRNLGVQADLVQGDVAEWAACERIAETAIKTFGSVDILVNNAGITRDNLLMRMSEEETALWAHCESVQCSRAFRQCRSGQLCGK